MAICKDCEGEVEWGELSSGKMIMLEAATGQPQGLRRFTLVKGKANLATEQDHKLHRAMYVCHWDTCTAKS